MAKTDNLSDFLTDVANSIRTKTGTTEQINAQDFSDKILSMKGVQLGIDTKGTSSYLMAGYEGTTFDDSVLAPDDTKDITNMKCMFYGCRKLTTIPLINTSNATNMASMFSGCVSLTSVPQLDTSKVTNMDYMFADCSNLQSIPQLDTSNVTNMSYMFIRSEIKSLPSLDTSKVTTVAGMFKSCLHVTSAPMFNTSNVTSMYAMFDGCANLKTVPAYDVSNVSEIGFSFIFDGCHNLKSILMTNIGADLNISDSTKFERSDLLVILNNLKTVTETKTLTMGATNLAKLTEEDKAIATNKG